MSRSRIGLIRHAPTSWTGRRYCGRSDPPLSTAGRGIAADLGAAILADVGPLGVDDRIVSSASRRAIETATAVAARTGASVLVDDRWREADCGAAEGLTFEAVQAAWPDLAARLVAGDAEVDWPDGERASVLHERIAAAWADVLAGGAGITLVVSHAGPLRIAAALAGGVAVADAPFPAAGTVTWVRPIAVAPRARLAR